MKLLSTLIATFAALSAAEDICLPKTHSTWAHTFKDHDHISHHHKAEYMEGDHLRLFIDAKQQKSLVYVMEDRDHSKPALYGVLTDYTKKLRWKWEFNGLVKKVENCVLENHDDHMEQICLATGAKKVGEGTLGESFKVQAFQHEVEDKLKMFKMDIETLVEAGPTNPAKPVEMRVMGIKGQAAEHAFDTWYDHTQWFDFSEKEIDPHQFTVPKECPM